MEGDMVTTIRVRRETKDMLDSLKIIDRETYDNVILRVLQYMLEDYLELNESTKKLLKQRMEALDKGNVFSTGDLLKRLREKRGKTYAK